MALRRRNSGRKKARSRLRPQLVSMPLISDRSPGARLRWFSRSDPSSIEFSPRIRSFEGSALDLMMTSQRATS